MRQSKGEKSESVTDLGKAWRVCFIRCVIFSPTCSAAEVPTCRRAQTKEGDQHVFYDHRSTFLQGGGSGWTVWTVWLIEPRATLRPCLVLLSKVSQERFPHFIFFLTRRLRNHTCTRSCFKLAVCLLCKRFKGWMFSVTEKTGYFLRNWAKLLLHNSSSKNALNTFYTTFFCQKEHRVARETRL